MSETEIFGVKISKWPIDELLYLPWHSVTHLTDEEKRSILTRAAQEGVPLPHGWGI